MTSVIKPMRICMVAGHFLPQIGGVERYVYNLSRALIRGGNDVAVVASQPPNTRMREQLDGIDLFRLPSILLAGSRLPVPIPFSKNVQSQLSNIVAWKPDVFVIHTHLFMSNMLIVNLAATLGRPCVLINHGSGYVRGGNPAINLVLEGYENALARRIGRKVHAAFGVSRAAARWLSQFNIETDMVIANGVDMTAMPDRDNALKVHLGIPDETCLIAYAARLLPEKGADTLLDVFLELNRSDAHLVIAGDGPMLEALRAKAGLHPRVHLLGATAHRDVLRMFGSADIMAYPSRYPEGQPTTVLEAGAMGCAVIATPMGGTAELIDDPKLGIIVADKPQLEIAVKRLIDDRPLRESMGMALRNKISANFDWFTIAADFTEHLRPLVQADVRAGN